MELLGACEVCGKIQPGRACRECWGCLHVYHDRCVGQGELGEGPYYCKACREAAVQQGVTDVTLDKQVM